MTVLCKEFHTLSLKEKELREKHDLYEFQIKEIDAVDPRAGEERDLGNELRILENSEKLYEATAQLYQSLYEGDANFRADRRPAAGNRCMTCC